MKFFKVEVFRSVNIEILLLKLRLDNVFQAFSVTLVILGISFRVSRISVSDYCKFGIF